MKRQINLSSMDLVKIVGILLALTVVILLNMRYVSGMEGKFYHFTSVNKDDVTGMTAEEVVEIFDSSCDTTFVNFEENGNLELMLSLSELGYSIDHEQLRKEVERMIANQRKLLPIHLFSKNYNLNAVLKLDQTVFQEAVTGDNFATPRTMTADATLEVDDEGMHIVPEVYGDNFAPEKLQEVVRSTIDSHTLSTTGGIITIKVDEDIYEKPEITADNEELNAQLDALAGYAAAKITYTFGSVEEVLDWNTISTWIVMDGTTATLSEEAMYDYIYDLAAKYNTIYESRFFTTSYGSYIAIPRNEYGYQIDYDGEYFQLLEDIQANKHIAREPVYAKRGFSRNGNDDLNGNYIEVNLSAQHLWMYRDGALVIETDVISGLPTPERETVEGAFAIPYKQSPANLVGQGGGGTAAWDVEVDYWMPFCDGQGLHDADWQYAFGGNIYTYNGSHGCINLPEYAAAIIYANCEENYPIILYK